MRAGEHRANGGGDGRPDGPARPDAVPLIGRGPVRHRRLRPRGHAFAYDTTFLLLPMRRLRARPVPGLARNRFGLLAFHDVDHGDGRTDALAWLEETLHGAGVTDADGEVWLQTYPRVLGYAFKPVSFWYCERADGALTAILAEVNNTFGERHVYLLRGSGVGTGGRRGPAWGEELRAEKVFHVSPFCRVEGRYRFRFMRTAERIVARVDHDDADGPLLETSVSGVLQPLTPRAVRSAFAAMPLLTLGVMARIHWQALKLWAKRVPFFGKPAPPQAFLTR